jgi:hypothetical protein
MTADGGMGADAALDGIQMPVPISLVRAQECPTGWTSSTAGEGARAEVTFCEPWPMGTVTDCGPGQARFVGDATCRAVGGTCPAGTFPDSVSGVRVLYVDATATGPGSGTSTDPFDQLSAALGTASAGTIIVLGKGTHRVDYVELPAGVEIRGACAAETVLETSHVEAGRALVALRSGTAMLTNVTLRGSLFGVVAAGSGSTLQVSGVVLDGVTSLGVLSLAGATVSGRELVVRNLVPATDGSANALASSGGGAVALERVLVDGGRGSAVIAEGAFDVIRLKEAHIHDVMPASFGSDVRVVTGFDGARVELTASLIEGSHVVGLVASGVGTVVSLEAVVIRDVSSTPGNSGGVVVGNGVQATADRLLVEGAASRGLYVSRGASAEVSDLVVRSTVAGGSGGGILVLSDGSLTLTRAAVLDTPGSGLLVGSGASATVMDMLVAGTKPSADMPYGYGVLVADRSSLDVARLRVEQAWGGVMVGASASADLTDLSLSASRGENEESLVGLGLIAADASEVTLARAHIDGARVDGILVQDASSVLTGTDVVVANTQRRACAAGCTEEYGSGVVASSGAHVALRRFQISDNALCGVRVVSRGTMDLQEGEISRNTIGSDIQSEGFDVTRISAEVAYVDNERNVNTAELPIPEVVVPSIPGG